MAFGATIVETRNLSNLKEVIDNHIKFLPSDWQLMVFGSDQNEAQVKALYPNAIFSKLTSPINSANDYNKLMTSIEFWNLIPFDKTLIFQHDSQLLRHGIEKYLDYDYVGATWYHFDVKGGNGGLSLRTKQKMIDVINKQKYNPQIHGNEDIYFCNHLELVGGKIAPKNMCTSFAVETTFNIRPIGVHAITKYLPQWDFYAILGAIKDSEPNKLNVNLITSFYIDKNEKRQQEIEYCLIENFRNPTISKVAAFLCDEESNIRINEIIQTYYLDKNKFQPILYGATKRPTYDDHFSVTQQFKDDINIISNSDIMFDEYGITSMIDYFLDNGKKKCIALSRYELKNDYSHVNASHLDYEWSQDCWIFYGGVDSDESYSFPLGKPGCDNRIAFVLAQNGYEVINPSKTIRTYHLHLSQVRHYTSNDSDRIQPPYKLLPTTFLPKTNAIKNESQQLLVTFTKNIKEKINFNFIKFGDGEFDCMVGKKGHNCDFHPYSKKLSDKLHESYNTFCNMQNTHIANWTGSGYENLRSELNGKLTNKPNLVFYDLILQQEGLLTEELFNFYKAIKESKRKKIFIGNDKLVGVKRFLNLDVHIIVPVINAFGRHNEMLSKCMTHLSDDCIFLFSAGMPAKALALDLVKVNKNITCLDCGSAFDPIFFTNTRQGQPKTETLKKFYKELLN